MRPVTRKVVCASLATVIVTLFTIDLVEAARGGGRGGGPSISRGGPASSGSFQRSRARPQAQRSNFNRSGQRQDVRQHRTDTRRDRADNRQESARNRQESRQDYHREVRDDRKEWYEDRWRRGRFVSARSWRRVGCNTTVYVNGVRYYECGGVRYERVYRGTQVTYIIVN